MAVGNDLLQTEAKQAALFHHAGAIPGKCDNEKLVATMHHLLVGNLVGFGKTEYSGRIAVLHVDGNHEYDNVRADIAAWADLVLPGGWIVIDDYLWPFGNGPRRVGDEYLKANAAQVELAFGIENALCIRMGAEFHR